VLFILDNVYDEANREKESASETLKEINANKDIILIINYAKTSLYLLSAILTVIERRNLLQEVNASPLTAIDESLTEELYQNIIQQSKHPNDDKLLEEFKRLTLTRDAKSNRSLGNNSNSKSNLTVSLLDESNTSGVINRVGGSINNLGVNSQANVNANVSERISKY